jgi:hypothetical protein
VLITKTNKTFQKIAYSYKCIRKMVSVENNPGMWGREG